MGTKQRSKLMAKLCHSRPRPTCGRGGAAAAAAGRRGAVPVHAARIAAMLHPMARENREAVVAHIGTGPGSKDDVSDLKVIGFDPRVAFGEAAQREVAHSEQAATLS